MARILIIDDEEPIRFSLRGILEDEGYEVLEAATAEEGLEVADAERPDLVFLDIWLPGMDGYQVCREIRHDSDVPIIMLSAKGEVFDKVLGLELGADDYIIKPFDSKELVARVKAVLRRFQPSRTIPVSATAGK
jgi:two-component system response regulator ResD